MVDSSGYDREHVAEFYDHVVPYRSRPDVQFFVDEARACGGDVLEIGCGTGRVLIPTARAGVAIAGLDASVAMLGVCRATLSREPDEVQRRVQLVEGDMRSFHLGRSFALATLPFRPFQHLISVEDQIACLKCIHRHLVPRGRLILDIFEPHLEYLTARDSRETRLVEPEFTMPDGRKVVRVARVIAMDRAAQVNEAELAYEVTNPDGTQERIVHVFPMRYLFRYEAEHLLARCGFKLLHVYGDYDRAPFGEKQPGEMICIAEKE